MAWKLTTHTLFTRLSHSVKAKVGLLYQCILDINCVVKPPVLISIWHCIPIKKIGEEFRLFRAQHGMGVVRENLRIGSACHGLDYFVS